MLWLSAGVLAVWIGNTTARAFRTVLSPSGAIEQSIIELFGSGFQWAGLLALCPVIIWATGKRVETGLVIPLAMLATGHGVVAIAFMFVIIGTGLFLHLDDRAWQGPSLSAAGAMLVFAFVSPWAAVFGGGVVLIASAAKKSVALPTLVVFFPSVAAALLLLVFFVGSDASLIDAIAAIGVVALHMPVLSVGVGVAAILMTLGTPHSAGVLAESYGVHVVNAPSEIIPELLADGFVIDSNARFALVEATGEDDFVVGDADGWFLVSRRSTQ